jgi:hypothetical protein
MDRKIASALIALLLIGAVLFMVEPSGYTKETALGQVGTSVGGILLDNTIWTPEGNPYVFVDNVTVAKDVTLTITPGTVVDLKLASFIIEGTLCAKGNETHRIMFEAEKRLTFSWPPRIFFNNSSTPWDESTGAGCIIDHAQIQVPTYQYEAIMGDFVHPKISNNLIYNYGNDAAAIRTGGLIVNNTILGGYRGIIAHNNATIQYNTVKDADVGICCGFFSFDPIYHPVIIGNLLTNNTVGIDDWSSSPYIANNTIVSNTYGIHLTSYTFNRNQEQVEVVYNNIYGNNYAVLVQFERSQKTVNMTYNWWGTTDASRIAQSIYDNTTDPSQTKVDYVPFLNEANPQASPNLTLPTSSASPTPTSTPEQNEFNIESNSTVSALSFNGTSSEISFTVNGTKGTTGYVKATISKNFMPNGENIKVYLDESPINSSITSNFDSWVITFTYQHSTHQVRINQMQNNNSAPSYFGYLPYIAAGVIVALLAFLCLIVWLAKSKD